MMKHIVEAQLDNVRIRPLDRCDIELLRQWRNDKEISRYLAPVPHISIDMQRNWFENYLLDQDNLTFAIEEKSMLKRVVGSISIYGIHGEEAEIGKIVIGDAEAHGKRIGHRALILALSYGYQYLHIKRFSLNVHEKNMAARRIYEAVGFKVVGKHTFIKGGYELEMELTQSDFEKNIPKSIAIVYCETNKDIRG